MAIITPQNFKDWVGVTDARDDTNISTAVAAANAAVESYCGQVFDKTAVASASTRVYYPSTAWHCAVDPFWETTALVVKVDTGDDGAYETTWALGTDFQLMPLNGLKGGATWAYEELWALLTPFPLYGRRPSVQVKAAWGWPAIPDEVFQATLLVAARLFRRKDSPDGLLGGFSDAGPLRVSRYEDPDAVRLLSDFAPDVLVA